MQNSESLLMKFKRPLYVWNLMIRNSTNSGFFSETLNLYYSMLLSGVRGNEFTFPLVLKACSNLNSIRHGTKVHSLVLRLGFHHVFVHTSLIDMYSKCSDLSSSTKVFDEMPVRSTVSWNTIISAYSRCLFIDEAILILREMCFLGFKPISSTFLSFLPSCLLPQGLSIQCCIFKLGFLSSHEVPLCNSVMKMYVKHGQVHEARKIFDIMLERSIISWTIVVSGHMDIGEVSEAFCLFSQMRTCITPDFIIFITLISGCAKEGNLLVASSVHSLLVKSGYDSDPIDKLLVNMYANCGDIVSARQIFDMAQERSVFLWTSIIAGYTHLAYPIEAFELFKKLLGTSLKPDQATLAVILSACADLGSLSMGREIEEYILANGLQSNLLVQTSLIHMFCKCGSIEKAKSVFERVSTKDLAAWSSMLNGFAIHGMGVEALNLFHEMQKMEGIKPDAVIYTSILLACSHSGLIEDGLKFFHSMQKDFGIKPSIEHYTCLIDLLGRAGQLELASKIIKTFPVEVQSQAWAAFMSACGKYRKLELGEFAAKNLFNLSHGSVGNYVVMSNLYRGAGKWKEAAVTRGFMDDRGLVKEPGWSYIEINDSVHVFLAGDRTHYLSDDIYKKLEELNAKLLEAGYVPETDTVIHDLEEEEKKDLLKVHSERLAIAFGLIVTEAGSTLRIIKNLRTCDDCHSALKFISKITERYLIVRDGNRFHHFKGGSCSCKDFW